MPTIVGVGEDTQGVHGFKSCLQHRLQQVLTGMVCRTDARHFVPYGMVLLVTENIEWAFEWTERMGRDDSWLREKLNLDMKVAVPISGPTSH